jgi:hypothetical protein
MCSAYTVFLAGKSPNIRSYTVYIYGSGQGACIQFVTQYVRTLCVGLARTIHIYIRGIHRILGREMAKYTVIYALNARSCSTLSVSCVTPYRTYCMCRVGQSRMYTPYMTVYLVISLPEIPYIAPNKYGSGQPYVCVTWLRVGKRSDIRNAGARGSCVCILGTDVSQACAVKGLQSSQRSTK